MAMPLSSATAVENTDNGRTQLSLIAAANDYLPDSSKPLSHTRYRLLTRLQTTQLPSHHPGR